MKKILFFLSGIIVVLLGAFILSLIFNYSLPYMPCGGSTLRGMANKCVKGYTCTYETVCEGCGGVCKPE